MFAKERVILFHWNKIPKQLIFMNIFIQIYEKTRTIIVHRSEDVIYLVYAING